MCAKSLAQTTTSVESPRITAGDIFLFYRPSGRDWIISLATRSPYFHVALCTEAHTVVEAVPKGVRRRDLRVKPDRHPYLVIPALPDACDAAVG